jgi:hypothetical protein
MLYVLLVANISFFLLLLMEHTAEECMRVRENIFMLHTAGILCFIWVHYLLYYRMRIYLPETWNKEISSFSRWGCKEHMNKNMGCTKGSKTNVQTQKKTILGSIFFSRF